MSKNLVRWLVLLAFVAWQVLMPVTSVGALQGGPDGIPVQGPNGETYYLVPFSEVKSIAPPTNMAESMAIAAASGCKSYTLGVYITNDFGQNLGRYAQKIDWCYNGSTITSKTRTRWGEVYSPPLQFNGNIDNSESGGVGQTYYRAWTQGEFCMWLPGAGCVTWVYPWVEQYVYGTGTYSGSTGGG